MIIGEIRRYLRDNNPIRVSRSIRDTAYLALQTKEMIQNNRNKEPSVDDIAKELKMTAHEIIYALDAIQDPISLFEPVFNDESDSLFIMDQVSDDTNDLDWIQNISLFEALKHLDSREKHIIDLRFFKGRTQMEVAEEIGISQAQVSRLEKNALGQMRKAIEA